MKAQVQHRDGEFFIEHEGRRIAELTYNLAGDRAIASHTWVDPQHRGGALARNLVEALVAWARGAGKQVVPACPYVKRVFDGEPGYNDLRG